MNWVTQGYRSIMCVGLEDVLLELDFYIIFWIFLLLYSFVTVVFFMCIG